MLTSARNGNGTQVTKAVAQIVLVDWFSVLLASYRRAVASSRTWSVSSLFLAVRPPRWLSGPRNRDRTGRLALSVPAAPVRYIDSDDRHPGVLPGAVAQPASLCAWILKRSPWAMPTGVILAAAALTAFSALPTDRRTANRRRRPLSLMVGAIWLLVITSRPPSLWKWGSARGRHVRNRCFLIPPVRHFFQPWHRPRTSGLLVLGR